MLRIEHVRTQLKWLDFYLSKHSKGILMAFGKDVENNIQGDKYFGIILDSTSLYKIDL